MRALIQRVEMAEVVVAGETCSEIGQGVLTLLGIEKGDDEAKIEQMIRKIVELRIFEDEKGKLNQSLQEVKGSHLIVSQFTLLADCTKGKRPSFHRAESPERANALYRHAVSISGQWVPTFEGVFQAHMKVKLLNDGPVSILLEI